MGDWQEREQQVYMRTGHRRLGVTIVKGKGTHVWDDDGKEYLDFVSGWAALSLGHSHPAVIDALKKQADELMHVTNDAYTVPQVMLAELLVEHSPFDRVYFMNSGSEAVELALKLARKYGQERLGGAYEFISAERGFHGRTMGALAAGGTPRYSAPVEPLPPGFVHVPFNDIAALKAKTTAQTCAVLLEPVQGEGGVFVADVSYLREVRAWCDEKGMLLVLDEVQTGMGRTGSLFAFEQYGIVPDIIAVGKGLGGGVAVSAALFKEDVGLLEPGEHGTTFGGNPLLTAAAYGAMTWLLEHDLPAVAAESGKYLMDGLRRVAGAFPNVTAVRGVGLLVAIAFDEDIAADMVQACVNRGLLTNPVKPNALRLTPPLTVSKEEIDQAVHIIEQALEDVVTGGPNG